MQNNAALNASTSLPTGRLLSLDALRGFDMIWILGIDELVRAWSKIDHGALASGIFYQMDHSPWQGFRFYDLIFPLFVFIAGVSLVFSLGKILETRGTAAALRRLLFRSLVLYVLGLLYYGGLSKSFHDIRLMGVLQRIALSYLLAGLAFIVLRRKGKGSFAGIAIFLAVLLAGYWALMTFVPVQGVGAGNFTEGKNLANYVDVHYLPLRKWDGDHDPEGLLSTLPAIGTCLIGVLAGILLREGRTTPQKKVYWLAGAGLAALAMGWLWGLQFPVIKKIWTSSYVLVSGGWSLLLLACFYQVIDVWCWRRWAMPFIWVGMNAILLYLLANFVDFRYLATLLVGGPVRQFFGPPGELLAWVVAVVMLWLIAYLFYRRKIFLRV